MGTTSIKKLTVAALLLAICVASQFLKNTSVFITGPIVNVCLIIATLYSGIQYGIIISIIAPITSFFITGSPIIAAVPLIMPCIMIGNIILILMVYIINMKLNKSLILSLIVGSVLKALFMGIIISIVILSIYANVPLFESKPALLTVAKTTFSTVQLITSLIGSAVSVVIWQVLKKIKQ